MVYTRDLPMEYYFSRFRFNHSFWEMLTLSCFLAIVYWKSSLFRLFIKCLICNLKCHMILYCFRMKSFEMAFESYPQLIMGLFIWQGLQIKETLNIISISVSAASAIYGFGDILVGFIYIMDSSNSSFCCTSKEIGSKSAILF